MFFFFEMSQVIPKSGSFTTSSTWAVHLFLLSPKSNNRWSIWTLGQMLRTSLVKLLLVNIDWRERNFGTISTCVCFFCLASCQVSSLPNTFWVGAWTHKHLVRRPESGSKHPLTGYLEDFGRLGSCTSSFSMFTFWLPNSSARPQFFQDYGTNPWTWLIRRQGAWKYLWPKNQL